MNRRIIPRLFDFDPAVRMDVPPASTAPRPRMRSGVYLIPTLMTLGNMSLGFFALVKALEGKYGAAATAIIVGHILDALDGRVARMTGTTSKFGVELDSLSDWITFCIAPSFLMYKIALMHNRLWGFPIAVFFVICGALRLARFNLKSQMGETKAPYFTGLPTPAAGGLLAIFALLYDITELDKPVRGFKVVMNQVPLFYDLVPAVMLVLSLLMVSEVRYSSMKNINLLRPRSMRALIATILILLLIYVYPQNMIFIFYVAYIGWGLTDYFIRQPREQEEPAAKPAGYEPDNCGK